jgi:hypothetical protein
MTEAEKNGIVDRYTRGQAIDFIAFALDQSVAKVRAVLAERGVEVKRHSRRNRAWGFRGGFEA